MKVFIMLCLVTTLVQAQPTELARQLLLKIKTEVYTQKMN